MILGKPYKWVKVNTAAIVDVEGKKVVVPTTKYDYKIRQAYKSASRIYAGMFAGIIKMLTRKNQFYVIPRAELKSRTFTKGIDIERFDGLSLSSINRPFSKLVVSKHEKSGIERWINPFALITDGTRNTNTFLYQMPVVKLSKYLLEMFHKSKLKLKGFQYELFGVPGITIFVDKESEEVKHVLKKLTNLPLSLEGDGIVISKKWKEQITVLTDLGEEMKLPTPFKMQGLARSKGITIAEFEEDRVYVEVYGKIFPVDVIMNTQGKRKNKGANIVLSGMRLRKYLGEDIPEIDTTNIEQLIELKNRYKILKGTLYIDSKEVGEVAVGINKFYIDLTHNMTPKTAVPNIAYIQAKQILNVIDYPLIERFPTKNIESDLKFIQKQIDEVIEIRKEVIYNIKGGDEYDDAVSEI